MRSVRFYPQAWPLHTAFVISRGSRTEARVVAVEIEENGVRGIGECTPYPRYGESEASVMEQIDSALSNALRAAPAGSSCCNTSCRGGPQCVGQRAVESGKPAQRADVVAADRYCAARLYQHGANVERGYAGGYGRSGARASKKWGDAAED